MCDRIFFYWVDKTLYSIPDREPFMIDPIYSGKDTTNGHFGHPGSFIEVPYRNMESGLQMTPHVDEHKSPQNSCITDAHPSMGGSSTKAGTLGHTPQPAGSSASSSSTLRVFSLLGSAYSGRLERPGESGQFLSPPPPLVVVCVCGCVVV